MISGSRTELVYTLQFWLIFQLLCWPKKCTVCHFKLWLLNFNRRYIKGQPSWQRKCTIYIACTNYEVIVTIYKIYLMFYNKKYHRVYGENVYPKCQKFLNAQWRKNYGGNSGIFRISPSVRYRKLNPNINLVVSPISFQNSSFVMSRMEFF